MKPNVIGGIALVIAVVSLALNGWLLYDRQMAQSSEKTATLSAAFSAMMDSYCKAGGTTSESDMVALAKQLPGADEAKTETEDGVKKLVVGYNTDSGWADLREALDCTAR